MRPVPRLVEAVLVVDGRPFDVGQDEYAPTVPRPAVRTENVGRGVVTVVTLVAGDRQRELLEVSGVGRPSGGIPYPLHGERELNRGRRHDAGNEEGNGDVFGTDVRAAHPGILREQGTGPLTPSLAESAPPGGRA
jgi:hypothetical protein